MNADVIEESIKVRATPEEIWRALTDSDELEDWWSEEVILEPRKGGKFREPWLDDGGAKQLASGEVLSVKARQEITFTWKEKNWEKNQTTQCTLMISDEKTHRLVTVRHEGWDLFPDNNKKKLMQDFSLGWKYHLKELKAYLDD